MIEIFNTYSNEIPLKACVHTPVVAEAVQIMKPFRVKCEGGFFQNGRTGDYLLKDEFGVFQVCSKEYFDEFYTFIED
jgi:hypothetical protein